MKYKVLFLIFGIISIVLAINYYRLYQYSKSVVVPVCAHTTELEKLRLDKQEWSKREDVFLKQNAELVTLVNELKMQINRKPQIIYKNVQKRNINVDASESITDLLKERYSPNH
jgi:hypothetical protein